MYSLWQLSFSPNRSATPLFIFRIMILSLEMAQHSHDKPKVNREQNFTALFSLYQLSFYQNPLYQPNSRQRSALRGGNRRREEKYTKQHIIHYMSAESIYLARFDVSLTYRPVNRVPHSISHSSRNLRHKVAQRSNKQTSGTNSLFSNSTISSHPSDPSHSTISDKH